MARHLLSRVSHLPRLEQELPDNLNDSFLAVASFLAAVAVMVVGTPPFAIVVPLVAAVMVYVTNPGGVAANTSLMWCGCRQALVRHLPG